MNHSYWLNRILHFSLIFSLIVILLGAYTRLKDAGLGCPDWPGCYGQLFAPANTVDISKAMEAFPYQPVETDKARIEMVHRYFAGTLGLLILGITVIAYRARKMIPLPIMLPILLVGTVIFQALLGMYTVTMRLNPTIVLLHLMGGFTTLSLLWLCWLYMRKQPAPFLFVPSGLGLLSFVSLCILIGQILLGGWVSTNYAALICPDFPLCQGKWLPQTSFAEAFPLLDLSRLPDKLSMEARMTIHLFHRIGAFVTLILLSILSFALFKQSRSTYDPRAKRWLQRIALTLLTLLLLQISLGITNVLALLPITVAVMHNGVALLLLLTLLTLNFTLYQARN